MANKTSFLEELRKERGFLSLTSFCNHYNTLTGESMSVGAMSGYEQFGKSPKHTTRVSQSRFDTLSRVLKLTSEEEEKLKKFFQVTRKNPLRKMTPHNPHKMVKERVKPRKFTEKISRRGGKHSSNGSETKLKVKKENSPKLRLSKEIKNYNILTEHLKPIMGTKMQNRKVKDLIFQLALYV